MAFGNSGDIVYVLSPEGVAIDCVRYTSSWPYANGVSMQLKDVALDNYVLTNWCPSQNAWSGSAGDKGTPGAAADCGVPDTVALTICQARLEDNCGVWTYLDTLIRVKGVVSFADTCTHTAYLQDAGCGIALYGWPVSDTLLPPARQMRPGDSIQVTGYLTMYAGLAEIGAAYGYTPEVVLLDSDKVVTVTSLPCSLITDAADAGDDSCAGEDYESEKVKVEGIDFVATGTFSPGETIYYAVCPEGDTVRVWIDSCSTFLDQAIPDGQVNVTGILTQYDWGYVCYCQGYQIIPLEISTAACVDPISLTIQRIAATPDSVSLRWQPNTGQPCDCYKIYYATTPFPASWTYLDCVCGQTHYEYAPPISTTAKLFYHVTAVESCP